MPGTGRTIVRLDHGVRADALCGRDVAITDDHRRMEDLLWSGLAELRAEADWGGLMRETIVGMMARADCRGPNVLKGRSVTTGRSKLRKYDSAILSAAILVAAPPTGMAPQETKRTVAINEEGIARVETLLGVENLYDQVQTHLVHEEVKGAHQLIPSALPTSSR